MNIQKTLSLMSNDDLAGELVDIIRDMGRTQDRLTSVIATLMSRQPVDVRVDALVAETQLREEILDAWVLETETYESVADKARTTQSIAMRIIHRARAQGDKRAMYEPNPPARSFLSTSRGQDKDASDSTGLGVAMANGYGPSEEESAAERADTTDRNEPASEVAAAAVPSAGKIGEEDAGNVPSPISRDLPIGIRRRRRQSGDKFSVEVWWQKRALSLGTFNTLEEALAVQATAKARMAEGKPPKDLADLPDDAVLAGLNSGAIDPNEVEPIKGAGPDLGSVLGQTSPDSTVTLNQAGVDFLESIKSEQPSPSISAPPDGRKLPQGRLLSVDRSASVVWTEKGSFVCDRRILRVYWHMSDGALYVTSDLANRAGMKEVELQDYMRSQVRILERIGLHLEINGKAFVRLHKI